MTVSDSLFKYKYRMLLLLVAVYVLSFADRQLIAVLAVQIRNDLSLTNLQVGLLYGTAFSFIYALAGIPMGRIADKWSRKGMIAIGLFLWSLVTILSGFAGSFSLLIAYRLVLGISQAMLSPAAYGLIAESFSGKRRALAFSFYAAGIFFGIGLSFLLGGTVSLLYDWRTAMIAGGIPGIILTPLVLFYIRESDQKNKKTERSEIRKTAVQIAFLLKKRTVMLHLAGFSALACTGYTMLAFFGTVMTDLFQRPALVPHYGWFLFGVSGTVILSGILADHLAKADPARRFRMGIVAAVGGLPFYIPALLVNNPVTAFILLGCGVLVASSYNGVAAALIQYFVKSGMRSLAGGLYLFVISIAGFGIGPPFAGWLIDSFYSGPLAISYALITVFSICSLVATICFIAAEKSYHKDAVKQ